MAGVSLSWLGGSVAIDWDIMPFVVVLDGQRCERLSEVRNAMARVLAKGAG